MHVGLTHRQKKRRWMQRWCLEVSWELSTFWIPVYFCDKNEFLSCLVGSSKVSLKLKTINFQFKSSRKLFKLSLFLKKSLKNIKTWHHLRNIPSSCKKLPESSHERSTFNKFKSNSVHLFITSSRKDIIVRFSEDKFNLASGMFRFVPRSEKKTREKDSLGWIRFFNVIWITVDRYLGNQRKYKLDFRRRQTPEQSICYQEKKYQRWKKNFLFYLAHAPFVLFKSNFN